MATGVFDFHSECLQRCVSFRILLPNDAPVMIREGNPHYKRPMKTLYLLHGYSGTNTDWLLNSMIWDFSARYNLCVVFPSGDNSFYLDGKETGRQYATYVGKELVDYTRKTFGLSEKREDTFIGGLSMGGFGAIHTGLQFSETFSKIVALSSALIVYNVEKMKPGTEDGIANYEYYRLMFGDPEKVAESRNNPETLVKEILKEGKEMPEFYLAVGTEDFLYEENQIFRRFLKEEKVPFVYHEGPGAHDYGFWNQHLEPAIQWLLAEGEKPLCPKQKKEKAE
ncbi:MAG: alpha/beta hydrolase-fold protein [Candidatus Limivivens sp.]|nr:alpha/beta hydrolase-fold protein [Candidatus Limivivens sp.]